MLTLHNPSRCLIPADYAEVETRIVFHLAVKARETLFAVLRESDSLSDDELAELSGRINPYYLRSYEKAALRQVLNEREL